jgi:C_GCAxxG_C_C family probable redox protein
VPDEEKRMIDRESLVSKARKLGFAYERDYRGCAQCTIAAVQDVLGVKNDAVFKAASGLAAGGGLLCVGFCGGYTGGVMMMSSLFGRRRDKFDDDRDERYASFHMANALHDRFKEKYGSVICREIHDALFGRRFDLWTPDGRQAFEDAGAHEDKCTGVVSDASAWVCAIILDELEKRKIGLGDLSFT